MKLTSLSSAEITNVWYYTHITYVPPSYIYLRTYKFYIFLCLYVWMINPEKERKGVPSLDASSLLCFMQIRREWVRQNTTVFVSYL